MGGRGVVLLPGVFETRGPRFSRNSGRGGGGVLWIPGVSTADSRQTGVRSYFLLLSGGGGGGEGGEG